MFKIRAWRDNHFNQGKIEMSAPLAAAWACQHLCEAYWTNQRYGRLVDEQLPKNQRGFGDFGYNGLYTTAIRYRLATLEDNARIEAFVREVLWDSTRFNKYSNLHLLLMSTASNNLVSFKTRVEALKRNSVFKNLVEYRNEFEFNLKKYTQQAKWSKQAVSYLNDSEKRIDPMAMVFPRVTKCTYHKFGPSGTIQNHDALCVLPINIINEKIYVFLWFWLILLTVITLAGILYHLFLLMSPSIIKMGIKSRTMNQSDLHLDEMENHFQVGDWKLLQILSKNMEPIVLGEFFKIFIYNHETRV